MFAVKVGDEVGYGSMGRSNWHSTGFSVVSKINGHGHIILANGLAFDKRGQQRGTTDYGKRLIEAEVLKRNQEADKERQRVRGAFSALEQKLKSMYGYTGNVHVTPELKAELAALVEAL